MKVFCKKIENETGQKIDIVIMVQGDEPMILPEDVSNMIRHFESPDVEIVNLMAKLKTRDKFEDKNNVKVVVNRNMDALYFSREPIPSLKKGGKNVLMMRQLCIIPFRRDFLLTFNNLPPTPLETIESIDMLRLLEHGYKVKIVPTQSDSYSVDTPEDLEKVEKLMKKDSLLSQYSKKI